MKLYIWEGVLADYTGGIAFAMAKNVAHARRLLLARAKERDPQGATRNTLSLEIARDPDRICAIEGADYCHGGA